MLMSRNAQAFTILINALHRMNELSRLKYENKIKILSTLSFFPSSPVVFIISLF